MKKILIIGAVIIALALVAGLGIILVQKRKLAQTPKYSGPIESFQVGTVKEYATLVLIAQDQGFFRDNGLDVTTTEYASGAPSLQGLVDGEVDVTIGSDFSGVSALFTHQNFQALTAIFDSSDVFRLIARKDRGINSPADLKGKKIGLTKKTMGEFFLGTFLTFNNLSLGDVALINDESASLAQAIDNGSIDAVVTFQPYAYEVEKKLGQNAAAFPVQADQSLYALLYASRQVIADHPDALRRFVQALVRAEQFIRDHPDETKAFFVRQFHYSDDYISAILSRFNFRVSVSQAMLLAMEDEARWAIENHLTAATRVPNYLDFIYPDALLSINPEAVTIIR